MFHVATANTRRGSDFIPQNVLTVGYRSLIMSTFIRHKGRTQQTDTKSRYKKIQKSRYKDTQYANTEKEIKTSTHHG